MLARSRRPLNRAVPLTSPYALISPEKIVSTFSDRWGMYAIFAGIQWFE